MQLQEDPSKQQLYHVPKRYICCKTINGVIPEIVNRRMTNNTIANGKTTKGQALIEN
jgi:hypothetical protein